MSTAISFRTLKLMRDGDQVLAPGTLIEPHIVAKWKNVAAYIEHKHIEVLVDGMPLQEAIAAAVLRAGASLIEEAVEVVEHAVSKKKGAKKARE